MDLTKYSTTELQELLKSLPLLIAEKEQETDAESERRKQNLFADLQDLAKKQGLDITKL